MFLRVAFLLFVLAATVNAEDVDLSGDDYLMFEPYLPGGSGSTHDTLELFILFDRSNVWDHVVDMILFSSEPEQDGIKHILAVLTRKGVIKGRTEQNFEATGELDSPEDSVSHFDLIWENEDDGFCRTYSLRIKGVDASGETHFVDKTIQVGAPDGSTCDEPEEESDS